MLVCPACSSIYSRDVGDCKNDGSPLIDQPDDPLIGRALNQYRVQALLGRGAAGCVYRAADDSGATFALKVLFGDVAAEREHVQRFRREAEVISKIDHPNVVRIFDFGATKSGLVFLAMEFVVGDALSTAIHNAGSMDPGRVARILRQVALGLASAHALGYVHRDLKPSNILVVRSPMGEQVKILDFGIAGLLTSNADATRLTRPGFTVGTPRFMAPEQFRDPAVGPAADLYSLGCVGYMMLWGQPPFSGTPLELAELHRAGKTPLLPECGPIGQIIGQLLATRPEDRPPSATAVADAIDAAGIEDTTIHDAPADVDPTLVDRVAGTDHPVEGLVAFDPRRLREVGFASVPSAPAPRQLSWLGAALIAIVAATLGGVVTIFAVRSTRPTRAPEAQETPAPTIRAAEAIGGTRRSDGPKPAPGAIAAPVTETEQAAEASAAPKPVPARRRPPPKRRRRQKPSPAPPPPRPSEATAKEATPATVEPLEPIDHVPASAPGHVNVVARNAQTPVAAEVFVDGRTRGRSPLRLELRSGRHVIEVVNDSGTRVRRSVLVQPGQTGRVVVDFATP